MPKFGKRSKAALKTCDPRLVEIMKDVIPYYDFSILEGLRIKETQNELFRRGLSKKKFPDSTHNILPLSHGIDVAPYPIDWKDLRRFDILAGHILMSAKSKGYNIRWGGDWDKDNDVNDQTFNDVGHFEIID